MAEKPPTTPRPDTIAAIATPNGRGGVGVIRVSGSNLQAFAHALGNKELTPRTATLSGFVDAAGQRIDTGLLHQKSEFVIDKRQRNSIGHLNAYFELRQPSKKILGAPLIHQQLVIV